MTQYAALIDGERGAYGVVVPDLPGCTSAGETIDQAYRNAIEAVRLWAEDADADGEKLPRARDLESLRADPEVAAALAKGAAIAMVPVFRDPTLPLDAELLEMINDLLKDIDVAAELHGLSRKGFIASEAFKKIKQRA
jgi:predicted RNase H-like HicB family nuclease